MPEKSSKLVSKSSAGHLTAFDFVRNAAMLSVVLYHSVAAYSALAPWWAIHDGTAVAADVIRQVFDVFMMPAFFFLAGWFFLSSLQKRGLGTFLWDKVKRLGFPWALMMLTIVPLIFYVAVAKGSHGANVPGFLSFWLNSYLAHVVSPQYGPSPAASVNQMHLWYVSLLLVFFTVAGVIFHFVGKSHRKGDSSAKVTDGTVSAALKALLAVALLTTAASFGASLLFPDTYWASVGLVLEFQPTKLLVYALYFAFGIFAGSKKLFAGRSALTRPAAWGALSLALAMVYVVVSGPVAAHPGDSQTLPAFLLLGYSAARSLLGLTVLMFLLSFGERHMSRLSDLNAKVAAQSFNIYLVHFFIVLFFQGFLTDFTGVPALAKAGIVFAAAVFLSFWLSRAVSRFPRAFAVGLAALMVLAAAFLH